MTDIGFKGPVPGAWRVPPEFRLHGPTPTDSPQVILSDLAFVVPGALSPADCDALRDLFSRQARAAVSVSGHPTADRSAAGSYRATGWGPELAQCLWRRMAGRVAVALPGGLSADELTPTDWYGIPGERAEHLLWVPTGISPALRFMEYSTGGRHNVHYDMGYDYERHDPADRRRTLMSVVWYLTEEPGTGGRTRFIDDGQAAVPVRERSMDDWTRESRGHEVLAAVEPRCGSALVFWHRMAHDVEKFTGRSRIVIRGDIEFAALG